MKKVVLLFIFVGTLLSFNFSTEAKDLKNEKNNFAAGKFELNHVKQTYYVYRRRYYRPRYRTYRTYRIYRTYRTVRYVPRRRMIYIPRYRYRRYYRQPVRYRIYRYVPRRAHRRIYFRRY